MSIVEPGANWRAQGRQQFWQALTAPLDLLIIGGGITGAGILQAAAERGLRAALIEQKDFAYGSSSRSSKLVHGGLRYLKQGRFGLTRSALKARNALLVQYPDLIEPRRFFLPYQKHPDRFVQAGLAVYDGLAGKRSRQHHDRSSWLQQFPDLRRSDVAGALSYLDAATDDCRLVMRVLQQAQDAGALAINYVAAETLLRNRQQQICGVVAHDAISDQRHEIQARVVISATGAWSDRLQAKPGRSVPMRPLRGSHLVLPWQALPLTEAIGMLHPQDQRPVYAVPWAGGLLFGTTDVEHSASLADEPHISSSEYDYLMSALFRLFPELDWQESLLVSSFAGVRPTFADSHQNPSAASREHLIEESAGWIRICGGKLTTFQLMADAVVSRACKQLDLADERRSTIAKARSLTTGRLNAGSSPATDCSDSAMPHYLGNSSDTEQHWLHALQQQAVQHLDDLMLRRTRVGLLEADGGIAFALARQQQITGQLQWDSERWQQELSRYRAIWQRSYAPQPFRSA